MAASAVAQLLAAGEAQSRDTGAGLGTATARTRHQQQRSQCKASPWTRDFQPQQLMSITWLSCKSPAAHVAPQPNYNRISAGGARLRN